MNDMKWQLSNEIISFSEANNSTHVECLDPVGLRDPFVWFCSNSPQDQSGFNFLDLVAKKSEFSSISADLHWNSGA